VRILKAWLKIHSVSLVLSVAGLVSLFGWLQPLMQLLGLHDGDLG
jgi:hypothetical protein